MKKIHRKLFQSILVFIIFLSANSVLASGNKEIQYLLSFISSSDCIFIRNGDEHSPQKAREHLEMKYNYAKKRIHTAEDFIDKVATKSSLSRKLYTVRCGEVIIPTGQWLTRSLESYRASSEIPK
jgi:Family of unknown function (DUF5329)